MTLIISKIPVRFRYGLTQINRMELINLSVDASEWSIVLQDFALIIATQPFLFVENIICLNSSAIKNCQ